MNQQITYSYAESVNVIKQAILKNCYKTAIFKESVTNEQITIN